MYRNRVIRRRVGCTHTNLHTRRRLPKSICSLFTLELRRKARVLAPTHFLQATDTYFVYQIYVCTFTASTARVLGDIAYFYCSSAGIVDMMRIIYSVAHAYPSRKACPCRPYSPRPGGNGISEHSSWRACPGRAPCCIVHPTSCSSFSLVVLLHSMVHWPTQSHLLSGTQGLCRFFILESHQFCGHGISPCCTDLWGTPLVTD